MGVSVVLAFVLAAFRQAGYWRDSETLFTHTIAVTGPNPMAEYSLGQSLELTRPDRALTHLQRSIEIVDADRREHGVNPPEWYSQAYVGIGTARLALAQQLPRGAGRTDLINKAVLDLQRSLAIDSAAPHAVNNLGVAMQMRQEDAARSPHPADRPAGTQEP
jgi:hypothetical protein